MENIKFIWLLIILSACVQDFEEKAVCGYYTPIQYKNNYDTIELRAEGIYQRKVYDRNKKLLLVMKGEWSLTGQRTKIKIDDFYMNLDDDLEQFPQLVTDTNMLIVRVLKKRNEMITFCVGHYPDSNCYLKIK